MIGSRPRPTVSNSQRHDSGSHGSPVEARIRSRPRSCDRTGSTPCLIRARTSVGETPRIVTPCRSTIDQSRSGAGKSGTPSARTTVPPAASAPTSSQGPMIQPRSVTQCSTSSACMSAWWATSCAILTRNPPCTWTAPLGRPVVPDVYMIIMGVSGSSGSHGHSAGSAAATSAQSRWRESGDVFASLPDRATMTWRTLGQATAASRATGSSAIALPRRNDTSAVTSATALPSSSRAATAAAPKPEKIGIAIAPTGRRPGTRRRPPAPSAGTARPGRPGRYPAVASHRPGGRSPHTARHKSAGERCRPHPPRSRQRVRGERSVHGDRGNAVPG